MGPDIGRGLDTIILFGVFGMIVAVLAVVIGIPVGVWYLFHHVSFH